MNQSQTVDQKGREEEHQDMITDEYISKPDPISDTPPPPAVVTEDSDTIRQFIEWPIIRSDGAHQPIQYRTTGHLLANGVDPENIQAACLVSMIMLSARLGYPISAMLDPDDIHTAVQLMDHCLKIVPGEAVIEFQELTPEYLYIGEGRRLDGKCIISPAINGFNKVAQDLKMILTRGHSSRQEVTKGRYGVGLSEHRSAMRVSVLGIDGGKPGRGLSLPSLLKIPIRSNQATMFSDMPDVVKQYGLNHSPLFKLRKSFQRLKPQPVAIPYEQQLATALIDSGCDHAHEKLTILKNLIAICAIINQPPPVKMAELGAMIYGTDEKEVGRWLNDTDLLRFLDIIPDEPIVATKVEYYLARLLLDGILIAGPTRYTDRQRQVFETVKAINLGKMGSAILKKDDDVNKLSTIAQHSGYWASREKVFEMTNRNGHDFSLSSVNNNLVELFEMGVIERAKPPKSRFFGYYVVTMELSDAIQLPAPDTIQDPVYEGKAVDVVNPFTGEVDRI